MVHVKSLWQGSPPLWNPADDRPHPTLEFYPNPLGSVRPCVLICPGGGYGNLAAHEDVPFRGLFHHAGYHAAVLRYRTQYHAQPKPLGKGPFLDAERAMHVLHDHAKEWHLDPQRIAVIGFSAGAHLVGTLGVHGRGKAQPGALILCYGVLLSRGLTHRGSMDNLCGVDDLDKLEDFFNLPDHVTPETPPAFLWHTATDAAVPVENSLAMAAALARHKVPLALHLFPKGSHGLGIAEHEPMASAWCGLCTAWLADLWKS